MKNKICKKKNDLHYNSFTKYLIITHTHTSIYISNIGEKNMSHIKRTDSSQNRMSLFPTPKSNYAFFLTIYHSNIQLNTCVGLVMSCAQIKSLTFIKNFNQKSSGENTTSMLPRAHDKIAHI